MITQITLMGYNDEVDDAVSAAARQTESSATTTDGS